MKGIKQAAQEKWANWGKTEQATFPLRRYRIDSL